MSENKKQLSFKLTEEQSKALDNLVAQVNATVEPLTVTKAALVALVISAATPESVVALIKAKAKRPKEVSLDDTPI